MAKEYCSKCQDFKTYVVTENEADTTENGKSIKFIEKTARCKKCDTVVYPKAIEKENKKSMKQACKGNAEYKVAFGGDGLDNVKITYGGMKR